MKKSIYTADEHIRQMLESTETCLNCGRELKFLPDKGKRRNRGYCSRECLLDKPPKMAYIEKAYGEPIKDVIVETLNRSESITVASEMLGIGRVRLHEWLNKLKIKKRVVWW